MEVPDATERIRIMLLDEEGLLRSSLARLLSLEAAFEVAGEFGNEGDALRLLQESSVDLVLLDFNLGADRANRFISAARTDGYQGRFLIVTAAPEAASVAMALRLGASGIFLKSEPPERLVQAIRSVQAGEVWIDPQTLRLLADECLTQAHRTPKRRPDASLGEREQKALSGIVAGLTNREIGAGMGLRETSVKNILQRLFAKAGVRTRSQLVRLAMEGSFGSVAHSGNIGPNVRPKPRATVQRTSKPSEPVARAVQRLAR